MTAVGTEAGVVLERVASRKMPFSVLAGGYYRWISGERLTTIGHSRYWNATAGNAQNAATYLYTNNDIFRTQATDQSISGVTIRCAIR